MPLFGTSGIRGSIEDVNPELALKLGRSVARLSDSVVIARDGRASGMTLSRALMAGIQGMGSKPVYIGVAPTHLLAYTARKHGSFGVMITASHNPPMHNGFKVFQSSGTEVTTSLENEITDGLDVDEWSPVDQWREVELLDSLPGYISDSIDYIGGESNLDIVVDTGHGVGIKTTPEILEEMGCTVELLNSDVNPGFPDRAPEPTAENIKELKEIVERNDDLDAGLAHDGDADRVVVVDSDGDIVPEDGVIAVIASYLIDRHGGGTVVITPNTSNKVDSLVEDAGGKVKRTNLGGLPDVIGEVDDLVFAAEPWKHIFPGHGPWVDGSVSAGIVALILDDRGLDAFSDVMDIEIMKHSVEAEDVSLESVMEEVIEEMNERYQDTSLSGGGLRVELPDGSWGLIRSSGTEPLIRIYGEGDDELMQGMIDLVEGVVKRV